MAVSPRGMCIVAAIVLATLCVGPAQCRPVSSDREFQDFMVWFKAIGGKAPSVGLARFPGMGTGVLATGEVKELDTVISVPMEYVACRTSMQAADDAASKALLQLDDDEDLVAAWLMVQRWLGEKSAWAPYIEILPKNIPLPGTFTDEELQLFEDRQVIWAAKRDADRRRSHFATVTEVVAGIMAGASDAEVAEFNSFDSYTWALNLVTSRALTLHGKKHLVPFADMFNYQPHTEERKAESGANFLKYHKLSKHVFEILADRAASPGDQLFEDYGDNDNEIYAQHHGFVANDNPFDCVNLELPPLPQKNRLTPTKQQLLQAMGITPRSLNRCINPSEPVPFKVHAYMKTLGMDKKALEACQPIIDGKRDRALIAPCFGDHVANGDVKSDVRIRRSLRDIVKKQLKRFTTSVDDDEDLLAGRLSDNERLAISFRRSRKLLLEALYRDFSGKAWRKPREKKPEAAAADSAGAGITHAIDPSAPGKEQVRSDDELKAVVQRFNAWFAASKPPVQAIAAEWVGGGMRIGTMATRDIAAEEVYLAVPNEVIMSRATARASPHLAELFKELDAKFSRGDPFHELLFHLVYEKFVLGSKSKFAPYIDIIPNKAEIGGPAFWTEEEVEELRGSESYGFVKAYQSTLTRTFNMVHGAVLKPYAHLLPPAAFTEENYKWAHGILDSRSIWWHNERHLVPLLDMINCVEGPDPSRVHSTVMNDDNSAAITKAGWDFPKGSQLFENYGQPNHIYFEYHGFSLDQNSHDCVKVAFNPDLSATGKEEKIKKRLERYNIQQLPTTLCVNPHELDDSIKGYLRTVHNAKRIHFMRHLAPYAMDQLAGFATTVAEDEALLAEPERVGGVGSHTWAAVRFRLSEKKKLHEILEAAEAEVEGHAEL